MEKKKWATILIILIVLTLSLFLLNKPLVCAVSNGINLSFMTSYCTIDLPESSFAKCVGEKARIYIRTGCFACERQQALFGEDYKHLEVIDCAIDSKDCVKEEIMYTPTWIIGDIKYIGYKTFEELSEITGCQLNQTKG